MSRSARLLGLLQLLQGRRRPIPANELARRLDVSERTVYRDIAQLVAQGAMIDGAPGLGYVLRPGYFLPPLMLDTEEIEALLLGLAYVRQRGDDTLRAASESARAKVEAVLPPSMLPILDAPIAMKGPDEERVDGTIPLALLRSAIREQSKLLIEYCDGSGTHTRRIIWPLALGFLERVTVICAWCEKRQDFRTFRGDRVGSASPEGTYPGSRARLLRRFHEAMAKS